MPLSIVRPLGRVAPMACLLAVPVSVVRTQTTAPAASTALYVLPEGVETRWASTENPRGEKGRGAMAGARRKGSPITVAAEFSAPSVASSKPAKAMSPWTRPLMASSERSDDWSSCVYFYLNRPVSGLPPLARVSERVAGL